MRQRKLKWAEDYLKKTTFLVRDFPSYLAKNALLELEIGCGKGTFLVKKAELNPKINYLGVDIQSSCLAQAIKKAELAELDNLHFALINAESLLEKFGANRFQSIYLNFSDPWPKARHEKRRLTNPKFLEIYYQLLLPGGEIIFKTDNQSLFDYSALTFKASALKIISAESDYQASSDEIISEYEEKFRNKGQQIARIIAKKEKEGVINVRTRTEKTG